MGERPGGAWGQLEPGDRVAVTGAAGFIGSAIVRQLLGRGARVRALVEPGGDEANLEGLDVDRAVLDVRDGDGARTALEGARFVFHVAALYGFWARDPGTFYDVNVGGTRNIVEAATAAGCQRVVYTSTVGTIGLAGVDDRHPADERRYADIEHLFGHYKRSKYVAEHEVLRAAAEGAPVVLVHPTFPVGPGDRRPTPTGKVVLDYLNGRMPGFVDTQMNVVHVDDLARGHLLALERGRQGRSYIAGGENLSMQDLLGTLASVTGLPAPRLRAPRSLALATAFVSEQLEGRLLRRAPSVPLEGARMATTTMAFDDTRARVELGYTSRPAAQALGDSARWFAANGYVNPARAAALRWDEDPIEDAVDVAAAPRMPAANALGNVPEI